MEERFQGQKYMINSYHTWPYLLTWWLIKVNDVYLTMCSIMYIQFEHWAAAYCGIKL